MFCYKYPHPAVTVDCVVLCKDTNDLSVLLVKRKNPPYKDFWALPGGFINIDESAENAIVREVEEETGIQLNDITQLHTYSSPERDPRERVISIAFITFVEKQPAIGGDDALDAQWFPLNEIPVMAFDHLQIITDALLKIQSGFHNTLL